MEVETVTNKLRFPSKSFLVHTMVLSFLTFGAIIIWLYIMRGLLYNTVKYGIYMDLFIYYFVLGLCGGLFLVWFIEFTMSHCSVALRVFSINDAGFTIGLVRRKCVDWADICEIGIAPFACGKIRNTYFRKNNFYVMYILFSGNSESFSEFGIFPIVMMKNFKKYGRIGQMITKKWISKWMQKQYIVSDDDIPREILWFEIDKNLYSEIRKRLPETIPQRKIYEKGY